MLLWLKAASIADVKLLQTLRDIESSRVVELAHTFILKGRSIEQYTLNVVQKAMVCEHKSGELVYDGSLKNVFAGQRPVSLRGEFRPMQIKESFCDCKSLSPISFCKTLNW